MAKFDVDKHFSSEQLDQLQKAYDSGRLEEVDLLIQQKQKALKDTLLNIAVTGEAGTGKSTLINAMRGLLHEDGDEERAAPTGVIETTLEPTPYPHLYLPDVIFWDLPGIGTPNFTAQDYLKQVNFECYDFFLIVSSCRFRENDAKLAQEIERMGKSFYFIRTKIDLDLHAAQKRRRRTAEKDVLEQIRNDSVSNLERAGLSQAQVFLLSSFEWEKYDYDLLQKTLFENLSEIRKYDILNLEEHILNIAVTGESGAGKSSLINALINLHGGDVGVTTREPTPHHYPFLPNIIFWDLPGVGTANFRWEDYPKKVNLENYDFYIIVSGCHFGEQTAILTQEIKKMDKQFYFVQTQIDLKVLSSQESEDTVLEKARKDCVSNLDIAGVCPSHIFLVSSFEQHKYDFLNLHIMLSENLPEIKKRIQLLTFFENLKSRKQKKPLRTVCSLM